MAPAHHNVLFHAGQVCHSTGQTWDKQWRRYDEATSRTWGYELRLALIGSGIVSAVMWMLYDTAIHFDIEVNA